MNEGLVAEVAAVRFSSVRLQDGYDTRDVDAFLDQLGERLSAGEPVAGFITRARFAPTRLRAGYAMGEVDDFLDRVLAEAEVARATG